MKKVLLLITVFALVAASNLLAQETSNVAVSAQVETALSLTPTPVGFGTIQAGIASYIQANDSDGTAETNLGTGATPGALQIAGTSGVDVTVSWTNGTLTDSVSGSNPTTFTPTVYLGTTAVTSGATDVAIAGGSITLNVGGSLAAVSVSGAYSTANTNGIPVTFTVQYTSV